MSEAAPSQADDEIQAPKAVDPNSISRATQKISAKIKQAATAENAQNVLGTKFLAGGMALVALAGGLDYFKHADDIYKAVGGIAVDAGQGDVVNAVEGVSSEFEHLKLAVLEHLPPAIHDHLAGAALALGVVLIVTGARIKLKFARGQLVRDLGRIIAGPGFVGIVAFTIISWRGAMVLRTTTRAFTAKLWGGTLGWPDLKGYIANYAPWAWGEVGAVLVLGVVLVLLSIGLTVGWRRFLGERYELLGGILRRSSLFGGLLAVAFYVAASAIAVMSYGGALRVLCWPWKTNRGAFLVTLAFMALGLGMARTGSVMMKREGEPSPEPAPAG